MTFLRQLYKQKPQAWGPVSAVQASIFKNAERIGIDPGSIELCMPMWGPGYQYDYSNNRNHGTLNSGTFQNNGILINPSTKPIELSSEIVLAAEQDYTIFISFDILTVYSPTNLLCGREDDNNYFGFRLTLDQIRLQDNLSSNYDLNGVSSRIKLNSHQTISYKQFGSAHASYPNDYQYTLNGFSYGVINLNLSPSPRFIIGTIGNGYTDSALAHQGRIYGFFIFKTALTDSQIAYFSDNPYYLLHRVPPVFYSVPGGAITIKTVTDTGSGLDGIAQISNILSVSDSGSGLDVFVGLAAGISVVDVGSGTDAVQPAASVTVQDTGVAIDLIQQISAACSVSDTGTGADNIVRILASLFVADTGTGSDIITVLKELLKTVTDSGTGTDSVSQLLATVSVGDTGSCTDTISQILADISVSDTGAGADFINLLKDILKTISDTGTGTDFVSIQPVSVSVYDAGIALDLIGHIAVALSVSDAGTVAEIISTIKTKLVTVTDTGTGSDSAPTISVSLTVSDVSAALDVVGQVLNSLTVSDTGSGLDRITKTDFNILPSGQVTVTFTIKTPGASFAMRTPKATFNIE